MKNIIDNTGKGLSIKELEERMELSVAAAATNEFEVCKRCDEGGPGPTVPDFPGIDETF